MQHHTPIGKKLAGIKAIVFDVFGTLIDIRDPRRPYGQLLQWAKEHGRKPLPDDADRIMCNNMGLVGVADLLGINIPLSALAEIEQELLTELASMEAFSETVSALNALKQSGYKIGLCGNLALPYAAPIKRLLPFELDAYAWSFEVRYIKPNPAIYQSICADLGCFPKQVLMIGDTLDADYLGPRAIGMQSLLLSRDKPAPTNVESIGSLYEFIVSLPR